MKKLLFLLALLPSMAHAAGAGGINISFPPGKGGGGSVIGFRSVFSTNVVTNSDNPDSPHPIIISTGTLQKGTTVSVGVVNASSMTAASTITAGSKFFGNIFNDLSNCTYCFGSGSVGFNGDGAGNVRMISGGSSNITFGQNTITLGNSSILRGPNGSAAAPTYTFSNCATCGLFSNASVGFGDVIIGANGAEQQRWFGSGGSVVRTTFTVNGFTQLNASATVAQQLTVGAATSQSAMLMVIASTLVANIVCYGTSTTGVPLFCISTAAAIYPTDFLLNISSPFGQPIFGVQLNSHVLSSGTAPILSGCGTGPSIDGDDFSGTVTAGSTSNGCTVTFANVYQVAPHCLVTQQTGSLANTFSYSTTVSAITVTETSLGTGKFDYVCVGRHSP